MPDYTIRRFVPKDDRYPDRYQWVGTVNLPGENEAKSHIAGLKSETGYDHFYAPTK